MARIENLLESHTEGKLASFDARLKIIVYLWLNICLGFSDKYGLLLIAILMIGGMIWGRLSLVRMLPFIGFFSIYLMIAIGLRVLTWDESGIQLMEEKWMSASLYGLRLGLMFFLALIFFITTSTSDMRDGIIALLKPVPFVNEAAIGLMISMVFNQVIMLSQDNESLGNARKARSEKYGMNVFRRLRFTLYPLIVKNLVRAGEISQAMEARSFSRTRTSRSFSPKGRDYVVCSIGVIVGAIALLIDLKL
ncbi:MAG: energy-coupling factor transporter transmembrane component T [Bacteroidota bacterium]